VFRRQHPFGPYILDFYCARARLVVEVDGQSHGVGDAPAHDQRRDAFLVAQGLRVMRYQASEVMADPNGVAQAIVEAAGWKPGP
jgi:very-short-patch-repair endonuclease